MSAASKKAAWEKLLEDLLAADQRRRELEAKTDKELPHLLKLLALIYTLGK